MGSTKKRRRKRPKSFAEIAIKSFLKHAPAGAVLEICSTGDTVTKGGKSV